MFTRPDAHTCAVAITTGFVCYNKYTKLKYFVHLRPVYRPKFKLNYLQTPYTNKHLPGTDYTIMTIYN